MTVAVAVPIYQTDPSQLARMALARCVAILGHYPLVFFGPRSLNSDSYGRIAPSASTRVFDDRHFSSVASYSALLLSPSFYEAFSDFDHLLIHQLDAFVFRDTLTDWCARGFDYIGAPWRNETNSDWFGVGNGGFSLRDVQSCLAVLRSTAKEDPAAYWHMERLVTSGRVKLALKSYRRLTKQLGIRENTQSFLSRFIAEGRPEDLFWGIHAVRFHPPFRIASAETALEFSIEGGLLEACHRYAVQPPFGCHQERFLEMISRFLAGLEAPRDDYEATVWRLAVTAGLFPTTM
jgi:hypothetical protein